MNRTVISRVARGLVPLVGFALGACSTPSDPQNEACKAMAHGGNLPWGYYPGYGCGPIPRARTDFSSLTIGEWPAEIV